MPVNTKEAMARFLVFATFMAIPLLAWISLHQTFGRDQAAVYEVDRFLHEEFLRNDEANVRAGRIDRTSSYIYATKEDQMLMYFRSVPVRNPNLKLLDIQSVETPYSEPSPVDSTNE